MFKIGKLFHLTHVVSDLGATDRWYDEVFAVTRFYHGFAKAAGRDASLIAIGDVIRSEEHTSELQSHLNLVCRLLLEKKKITPRNPAYFSVVRSLGIPTCGTPTQSARSPVATCASPMPVHLPRVEAPHMALSKPSATI